MSKRILFFGNEQLATGTTPTLAIIAKLLELNYEIASIVISQANYQDSKRILDKTSIEKFGIQNNIPLIYFKSNQLLKEQILELQVDTALLVAYGKIIPTAILDLFKNGIINVHPSLLPAHRGPTPIESALRNGDQMTGVSLIKLISKMDAGPIYSQEAITIPEEISKQSLVDQLSLLASQMIEANLDRIINNELIPEDQNDNHASYDHLIKKEDSWLNVNQSAELSEREIRAYLNWPKSKIKLSGIELIVTKAHVIKKDSQEPGKLYLQDQEVGVYTAKDILVFDRVQPISKNEMSIKDFLLGYRSKLI